MRPRLLFVTPRYLFPTDSGGKIRTADILRGMKGGRFEVTLASPRPSDGPARHAAEIDRVCDTFVGWEMPGEVGRTARRLAAVLSDLPVPVASDRSAPGSALIAQEIAKGYDVVVVDFIHAAVLVPETLPVPGVVFTHNVEAEIFHRHATVARNSFWRWLWRDQYRKMAAFEQRILRRYPLVIAVSERDRDQFRTLYGVANAATIPTGVDLDFYSPPPPDRPRTPDTVVFTASMDSPANIDGIEFFMEEVWPALLRRRSGVRFTVVGRHPPERLVSAARQRGFDWHFTGFVDDVRTPVREAAAYVIPLRVGGGTRIKVYEAMSMGCPVVATTIGVEGLPIVPDQHYLRADSAEDFAAALARLLEDRAFSASLAAEAGRFVRRFSSRNVAKRFEELCMQVTKSAVPVDA